MTESPLWPRHLIMIFSSLYHFRYEPLRGHAQVKVDSTKVKMKVVFDKMLKKRNLRRTGHEYVLEKASEPGVSLDLEAPLSTMGTLEFVLTRGDSE